MDKARRKEILEKERPEVVWRGEPPLGAWYTEEEIEAAVEAIRDSMNWTVGFNRDKLAEFEEAFAQYCGTRYAISVNSAGPGLDMAMMCLDLEPGDEVICPAINFSASHLAVIGQGGKLVLCESDPRTFNVDPNDVERRITPRTRAIFPVHMNGLSAPMDDLLDIAERHPHPKHGPLKVIGDAARACGGGYKGTKIGKKGWMTVFSFHTQKLITTLGEGGMVVTDDPEVEYRIRRYRFFGGGELWGSSYMMTKVQAAVGLVQLRRLDEMNARRRQLALQRTEMLKEIPELTPPYEPPECEHTYYLYTILVPKEWAGEKRDRLVQILREEYQLACVIANPPTYQSHAFIRRHVAGQRLPISEELGSRLFCPPLHPLMTEAQNEYVVAALAEAVERVREE